MTHTDSEIQAMQKIGEVLEPLDDEAKTRVLEWAHNKFHGGRVPVADFERFPDLFDAVRPSNEADRALAAAYWLQIVDGATTVTADQVDELLKEAGQGVTDIKKTMGHLEGKNPSLAVRTDERGTSKTYKLTTAGIEAIESELQRAPVG